MAKKCDACIDNGPERMSITRCVLEGKHEIHMGPEPKWGPRRSWPDSGPYEQGEFSDGPRRFFLSESWQAMTKKQRKKVGAERIERLVEIATGKRGLDA